MLTPEQGLCSRLDDSERPLPRLYFDIDDRVSVLDHTGINLADAGAATTEAFRRAAEYGGDPANLRKSGVIVVTVGDGPDSEIMKVRLICQIDAYETNAA